MKKILQLALGLLTGIGGFLEIGSITTAAQAGASFGFQLIWAIALGTICLGFLVEMSGRLSAVSKQTVVDALRSRFGFRFYIVVLAIVAAVSFLVLIAELGGIALSLQMLTGVGFPWWVVPVAFFIWVMLWKLKLDLVENGASALGLVTICFVVAAFRLHPHWGSVAHSFVPSLPTDNRAKYGFLAVSILGASITPYLMFFYSSGAVEDEWDESYIPINRFIAGSGMSVGGLFSIAVLIAAALTLRPAGINIEKFEQSALLLTGALPRWGFVLFALSLAFGCLGAALEISLALSYMFAQGLGWNWSENEPAQRDARFSLLYTIMIALAAIPLLFGVDPIQVTMISMALTAASLPFSIVPFLFLMNDKEFCGEHRNGWVSNSVVVIVIVIAFVLSVIAIPLQVMGG
ncbi:MAG: divalent metal cation transporter [Gemmatimonadaceae bacterium]|nr:divalent metal cation transporter [Gemmatimonadaceae bacterium]